jgi:flagellar basal body rod protein FlgG
MSTLTGHLSLYATQSLKAIDNWMNVTQSNIGGSLRNGFKEVELMYGGNLTHELKPVSQSRNGVQIAEQTLTTGNTRVKWEQGEIIKSVDSAHMAINGDGFFMVYDPDDQKVFLTRDGEFRDNGLGQCINSLGQVLVDAAMAINLGLDAGLNTPTFPYTAPTSFTPADLADKSTAWAPITTPAGANGATPFGLPSAGDAGDFTIQAKLSFFAKPSNIVGPVNVSFRNDNFGFMYVNGNLVASNVWPAAATTVDISPYLKEGANIISVQSSNAPPAVNPGGFVVTGTITGGGYNGGNIVLDTNAASLTNRWAVKAYSATEQNPNYDPFKVQPEDVLLVSTNKKDELKYSKFGSTIWDSPFPIDNTNYTAGLPNTNGLGIVLNNALEASNVKIERNITELASLGKIYNGFVQLIKVYNSNLDEVLGFIR